MKQSLSLFLIASFPALLLANGGGYHHGQLSSGTLTSFTPTGTENIQIAEENLNIALHEGSARVNVQYQMVNVTDKTAKVTFGFPVETIRDAWRHDTKDNPEKATLQYCQNYQILLNGKPIKHQLKLEKNKEHKALKHISGWLISSMKVPAKGTVSLQIKYNSVYNAEEMWVSEDYRAAAWTFKYRLSTGAVWHGPISKGTITITAPRVPSGDVRILKPANTFKKENNAWVWKFTDLEPTLAHDITIQTRPAIASHGIYSDTGTSIGGRYYVRGGKWYHKTRGYQITASSTLQPDKKINYSATNLRDWSKHSTAWSEGVEGQGTGESITATFKKPIPLNAFLITNGYTKPSPGLSADFGQAETDLYEKNNRVKDAEILINGKHKHRVILSDTMRSQLIPLPNLKEPVKTFKLTIRSVYPGTKFTDTCLSDLAFLRRLTKKPKEYGAR